MFFRHAFLLAMTMTVAYAADNGLARTPQLGWNTWCALNTCGYDVCYEAEIRAMADAMVANGMRDLGYTMINLDDCWGYPRDNVTGEYRWDPSRFPSGIPALVQYLAARGFTLGVYTDSGIYTCSSGQRKFKIPGSFEHYAQDAATFVKWGVRYVKMDWCNTVAPNGTQLDPRNVYPTMSLGLNATGVPAQLASCEWGVDNPWEWAMPWMNSWRIGADHHDTWTGGDKTGASGTDAIIETLAGKAKYAGPGGWNDPDFVYTGGQGCPGQTAPGAHCPGQTDTEYITEFTIWAVTASPIIVATNVQNMTDIMTKVLLNKEMIAVHQDRLGIAGDRIGYATDAGCPAMMCQLWGRPLSGYAYAAVMYNRDSVAHNITFDFRQANITGTMSVRDLWEHKDVADGVSSYTALVEGHGVVAVRLYSCCEKSTK